MFACLFHMNSVDRCTDCIFSRFFFLSLYNNGIVATMPPLENEFKTIVDDVFPLHNCLWVKIIAVGYTRNDGSAKWFWQQQKCFLAESKCEERLN